MLEAWNSGDTLTVQAFGQETEVFIFSVGDNCFDENGDYKEEGFPLNREELDCLNWFLKHVDLSDYRREITAYYNKMYEAIGDTVIMESDLEQEIQITGIAVNISEITQSGDGSLVYPEISFRGECKCEPEHGICIGFRDQKFLGIHAQDWTL